MLHKFNHMQGMWQTGMGFACFAMTMHAAFTLRMIQSSDVMQDPESLMVRVARSSCYLSTEYIILIPCSRAAVFFLRSRRSAYFIKQERVYKTEQTRTLKPTDHDENKQTNKTEAASNRSYRSPAKKKQSKEACSQGPRQERKQKHETNQEPEHPEVSPLETEHQAL